MFVQRLRMVPVAKVADAFGARVLAARLGSDGIVTQLRGGGLDGPYPMCDVEVLVSAADLEMAREILLADEVESAFDEVESVVDADLYGPGRAPLARWIVLSVVLGLVLFAYVNTIGYQAPPPARELDRSGAEEPG
ncbi:hypothetical protein BH23ACT1_BH23ACT1_11910 [soil metagenome]